MNKETRNGTLMNLFKFLNREKETENLEFISKYIIESDL